MVLKQYFASLVQTSMHLATLRSSSLILGLAALLTAPLARAEGSEEAKEQEQPETVERARLELKLAAGKRTFSFDPQTLAVGEVGVFTIEDKDHKYELRASFEPLADKKHTVVLHLMKDAEQVLDGAKVQLALGDPPATQRAGASKIIVRLFKDDAEPKKKKHALELPDGDDPLTGL